MNHSNLEANGQYAILSLNKYDSVDENTLQKMNLTASKVATGMTVSLGINLIARAIL